MNPEEVSIYATGDVELDWPNPESLFEPTLPSVKQADILFGQLEANLSEKGEPQLYTGGGRRINPNKVSALTYAGFDILSFASNHTLDRGEQALFESIDTLTKNNIAVVGVGKNIDEARKPVILERKGVKVAFLAYCSALPKGYDARPDKSGAVPMRASTFYEQVDWQPGTPPRIITLADKANLAAMVEDIKKVRPLADVVVMSIHWGVHFVPAVIAMYQREVGHAAIDAGVDLILGTGDHILKGIEVYKGKVIFYSLCNFILPSSIERKRESRSLYGIKPDPEYPLYYFAADSRKTIIAKCTISNKRIETVSFLPVMINKQAQPEVMRHKDKGFEEVLGYMKDITESQGLGARYEVDGDEVTVCT